MSTFDHSTETVNATIRLPLTEPVVGMRHVGAGGNATPRLFDLLSMRVQVIPTATIVTGEGRLHYKNGNVKQLRVTVRDFPHEADQDRFRALAVAAKAEALAALKREAEHRQAQLRR